VSDGESTGRADITVTVKPVNDKPIITAPSTAITSEDTSYAFVDASISVYDVDFITNPLPSAFLTASLSCMHGQISMIGYEVRWEVGQSAVFSASLLIKGSVNGINNALSNLLYQPDDDYNGYDFIKISVSDNGHYAGINPKLLFIDSHQTYPVYSTTAEKNITVYIAPRSDPPVITLTNGTTTTSSTSTYSLPSYQSIPMSAILQSIRDVDSPPTTNIILRLSCRYCTWTLD